MPSKKHRILQPQQVKDFLYGIIDNHNSLIIIPIPHTTTTSTPKQHTTTMPLPRLPILSGTRLTVLLILCLQNSIYTVLRRYSQGILHESYSKYEVLLLSEIIKILFSAYIISQSPSISHIRPHLTLLLKKSFKMWFLAVMYGFMNILSFVALRNIGAGMFTIFAQCKILTTATFSSIMLQRRYSLTKWRALIQLMLGVVLFSEPIWNTSQKTEEGAHPVVGTVAVLIEVTLSGFASIYFEKVIKADPEKMTIWERNFQLGVWSVPIYILFLMYEGGGEAGYGGGWSRVMISLSILGAAGGLLVALSIKYGDSILKTLATTGAIVLSSLLDHFWLGGPLTPVMIIAGATVVIAICNYTFDATPPEVAMTSAGVGTTTVASGDGEGRTMKRAPSSGGLRDTDNIDDAESNTKSNKESQD